MMLQPLIENAIKHGRDTESAGHYYTPDIGVRIYVLVATMVSGCRHLACNMYVISLIMM